MSPLFGFGSRLIGRFVSRFGRRFRSGFFFFGLRRRFFRRFGYGSRFGFRFVHDCFYFCFGFFRNRFQAFFHNDLFVRVHASILPIYAQI